MKKCTSILKIKFSLLYTQLKNMYKGDVSDLTLDKIKEFVKRLETKGLSESKYFMKTVHEFYQDCENIENLSSFSKKYNYWEIKNGKLVAVKLIGALPVTRLTADYFVNVEDVKYVKLFETVIESIAPDTFKNFHSLATLSIKISKIRQIDGKLFDYLNDLEMLIIAASPITSLPLEILLLKKLNYVSFADTNLPRKLQNITHIDTEDMRSKFEKLIKELHQ